MCSAIYLCLHQGNSQIKAIILNHKFKTLHDLALQVNPLLMLLHYMPDMKTNEILYNEPSNGK
jgi:hypothetical protein